MKELHPKSIVKFLNCLLFMVIFMIIFVIIKDNFHVLKFYVFPQTI